MTLFSSIFSSFARSFDPQFVWKCTRNLVMTEEQDPSDSGKQIGTLCSRFVSEVFFVCGSFLPTDVSASVVAVTLI